LGSTPRPACASGITAGELLDKAAPSDNVRLGRGVSKAASNRRVEAAVCNRACTHNPANTIWFNEVLCKVIAHNLCVLIACIHEIGLPLPDFGSKAPIEVAT
jgi:hypothetical protein